MSLHALALHLGMTVGRLADELSYGELMDWVEFFKRRDEPKEVDWAAKSPGEIASMFGAGHD
jgi:hypothetical protein